MSRYYTPRTLAQTWDCSPDVVYDLLRTGKLKGFRVGRHWRVSDEARLEYEQRKSDTAAATAVRKAPLMRVV